MSKFKEEVMTLDTSSQKDDKDVIELEVEKADNDATESEDQRLSTTKIVILAAGMMMTFFIGVSTPHTPLFSKHKLIFRPHPQPRSSF
jgi:hypothetical protein